MTGSKLRMVGGILLILLGILFLLAQVFSEEFDLGDILKFLWPVGLILLGFFLLWRQWQRGRPDGPCQTYTKVFGDLKLDGADIEPDGLDAALGIGDLSIDLSRAQLAEKEYSIDVRLFIGDIKIVLPAGTPVHAEGNSLIGELHLLAKSGHGLGNSVVYESEDYEKARTKIRLRAGAVLGDIIMVTAR